MSHSWTFEEKSFSSKFQRSGCRWETDDEAVEAAVKWVQACLLNGLSVCVRVIEVDE